MLTRLLVCNTSYLNTVKPVYNSMEPENVPFMSSCPLYSS
jgi:hypothetical protein